MSLLHFLLINLFFVIAYFVYLLLEKGKSHFSVNRTYLVVAPLVCFALPFVFDTITESPVWTTILPAIEVLQTNEILGGSSSLKWNDGLLYLGFFISIVLVFRQLMFVFKRDSKTFYKDFKGAKVYLLSDTSDSFSFLHKIYLNPNAQKHEDLILLHEYAHCKGYHSLDVLYISLLKGMLWFNPIVYLWMMKVKENHEFIADNYVLQKNVSAKEYGNTLVSSAFNVHSPTIVNAFNSKSVIRKRLEKFNHKNQYNMKQLILVPVLAGMIFISMSLNERQASSDAVVQKMSKEVDVEASFPGGQDALYAFIAKNFIYPKSSVEAKSEGKVYVQFTVGKDGALSNFNILRGLKDEALNESALSLLKKMPTWIPAQKDGENVESKLTLPINFQLN